MKGMDNWEMWLFDSLVILNCCWFCACENEIVQKEEVKGRMFTFIKFSIYIYQVGVWVKLGRAPDKIVWEWCGRWAAGWKQFWRVQALKAPNWADKGLISLDGI